MQSDLESKANLHLKMIITPLDKVRPILSLFTLSLRLKIWTSHLNVILYSYFNVKLFTSIPNSVYFTSNVISPFFISSSLLESFKVIVNPDHFIWMHSNYNNNKKTTITILRTITTSTINKDNKQKQQQ